LVAQLRGVPANADQVVAVIAAGYGRTTATFQAFQRVTGHWHEATPVWPAWVGVSGFAPPGAKREGDGRTPSGTYGFGYGFGIKANPGVRFGWRPVSGSHDVWDDDPSSPSYNLWVDTRAGNAGRAPEPLQNAPAYNYSAVRFSCTSRPVGRPRAASRCRPASCSPCCVGSTLRGIR